MGQNASGNFRESPLSATDSGSMHHVRWTALALVGLGGLWAAVSSPVPAAPALVGREPRPGGRSARGRGERSTRERLRARGSRGSLPGSGSTWSGVCGAEPRPRLGEGPPEHRRWPRPCPVAARIRGGRTRRTATDAGHLHRGDLFDGAARARPATRTVVLRAGSSGHRRSERRPGPHSARLSNIDA